MEDSALSHDEKKFKPLGQRLIEKGFTSEARIREVMARQTLRPGVRARALAERRVPLRRARAHAALPGDDPGRRAGAAARRLPPHRRGRALAQVRAASSTTRSATPARSTTSAPRRSRRKHLKKDVCLWREMGAVLDDGLRQAARRAPAVPLQGRRRQGGARRLARLGVAFTRRREERRSGRHCHLRRRAAPQPGQRQAERSSPRRARRRPADLRAAPAAGGAPDPARSAPATRRSRRPRSTRSGPPAAPRTRPAGASASSPTSTRPWPAGTRSSCTRRSTMRSSRTSATMALTEVLEVWRRRIAAQLDGGAAAATLIVNRGRDAGASLEHPHAQLFGTPVVPPLLLDELLEFERFGNRYGGCVLCAEMMAPASRARHRRRRRRLGAGRLALPRRAVARAGGARGRRPRGGPAAAGRAPCGARWSATRRRDRRRAAQPLAAHGAGRPARHTTTGTSRSRRA